MAGQKIYSASGSKNKAPLKAVVITAKPVTSSTGTKSGGGTGQAGKKASSSKYRA